MRDFAFIACWLVLLPLACLGPHLGVMLWAWSSLLAPSDNLFGLGTSVPFVKLAALTVVLLLVIGRREGVRFHVGRTAALLIVLGCLAVAAQATTLADDPAPGWDLCQKYLKVLALGLAVLWTMTDRQRVHGLLMACCLGIGYIGVDEGGKFILSGSAHKVLGSPSLGDNNQIALDLVVMLPMLLYLHSVAANRLVRAIIAAVGLLSVVAVIATFSRGGAVGLAIVAIGSALQVRRKGVAIVVLLASFAVGAALVGDDWVTRVGTIENVDADDSFMGRVMAWKVSTALALSRPLLGGGFHAIQHIQVWARQGAGFAALDFIPSPPLAPLSRAAHSIYFEMLGDLGFTGLICLVLLLLSALRDAGAIRRLVGRSARPELAWAAELAGCLRLSLLAFMISGGLLSAAYYDIDYLLLCLLAATRAIVERALLPQPATDRRRPASSMQRHADELHPGAVG